MDLLAYLHAGGPCYYSPAQLSPLSPDPCTQQCPGAVLMWVPAPSNSAYLQLNSSRRPPHLPSLLSPAVMYAPTVHLWSGVRVLPLANEIVNHHALPVLLPQHLVSPPTCLYHHPDQCRPRIMSHLDGNSPTSLLFTGGAQRDLSQSDHAQWLPIALEIT